MRPLLSLESLAARLRPAGPRPRGRFTLRAAVAIALVERPSLEVLLMRRAEHPDDPWSGHVSLPGGRAEPGDADDVATARREAREELGLDLGDARVIGALDPLLAKAPGRPRPLAIAPIVFLLPAAPPAPVLSAEATRAFWLPLEAAARGELDAIYPWRLGPLTLRLPCWRSDGEIVWGLTHRILCRLLGVG